MKSWVLYHGQGYLVVNKPAGVLSQRDKSGDEDLATLLNQELKLPFLAPVHRLDRNTSGLILLATDSATAKALTDQLQANEIEKTYLAIAKGDPGPAGTYDQPLRKDEARNQSFVHPKGDKALTHFTQLQKLGNSSLMEVRIETGRPHQIRAHFAHAGHALLGDRKYGKKPWSEIFGRPALHSARLKLADPKTRQVKEFKAGLPDDMRQLLLKLGGKPL